MSMTNMQKAKAQMLIKHVFFASLLLTTKVVPDDSMPTAYTDYTKIGYNPDFIESLDKETVLFVLAHEIMHMVLKHGMRVQGRDREAWNIAADHAINLQLKKAGFKLWKHCCQDPRFEGMSAEQIYDIIIKEPGKKGGRGDDQGGMSGDVRPPPDMTAEDRAVFERRLDQNIAQAASMARMAGKLSADLARLVEGALNPPLPWRALLREFMTQTTPEDETWARRNRRFPTIYLPTRWSEKMGEVVIIGDTSGSMGNEVFAQIGAEMTELVEQVKPERVRVIWADDAPVSREEIFEPGDPIVLHPKGGGGTDMRKPLRFVERYDPVVVVLITDGYTPWPASEPPYPLIVCCTTEQDCPVGSVVRMSH
jgi:predicted metal-dependent peptidase